MKAAKKAFLSLITVILLSVLLPQPVEAARKYKAGDWLTKEEFFELYGLDEFIGWGWAGGNVGEAIGDSETGLYPVKIKATLIDIEIGSVAVLGQRILLSDSFQQALKQKGEKVLLGSNPVTLKLSGSESGISTDYGFLSYSYQLTLQDLTYSYSRGFLSTGSPFGVAFTAKGDAESSVSYSSDLSDEDLTNEEYRHVLPATESKQRMQCAIDDSGEMTLTAVFKMNNAIEAETYNSNVWVKFRVDEVQLGKLSGNNGGITISLGGSRSGGKDDSAGPLATLVISILAILFSILFGAPGGFAPAAPAGAPAGTGTTPAPTPPEGDLSRRLRFDSDGDIEATDPVNGQKRTFVNNGDGTYTDPVSGATYTPRELSEQLEHRADNAGTIGQDEAQFEKNVREDSLRNKERSEESRQLEEDIRQDREERARREKIERIATDLGMSGASEKEVRDELLRRLERDEEFRQKMNDYARRADKAVDVLEATVDMADYGMAIGEAVVPGGSAVSATYKGIKNIGSTVAEKGMSAGTVIEGAIKGGTEAAGTLMKPGIGKVAVTFGGTVAGEIADAVNDGEDLTRATMGGFVKGAVNAASGAAGDAFGDKVKGDGLLNKTAETIGKVGETAFGKKVSDPMIDKLTEKKNNE